MTSALTPTGGTPAWRALRAHYAERIHTEGHLPCRRCGHPITEATPWDLGHPTDRVLGGNDHGVWPEHRHAIHGICAGNRAAGGHLGQARRAAADATRAPYNPADHHRPTDRPTRIVVALFGPPAAGKTTAAHANPHDLTVHDLDDPQWNPATFTRALTRLGHNPAARAVVIRAGATRAARTRTLIQVRATHAWLLTVDPAISRQRITARHRGDGHRTGPAVSAWWTAHRNDPAGPPVDVPTWPGAWPDLDDTAHLAAPATEGGRVW